MKGKDDNIGIYLSIDDWKRTHTSRWLDAEICMTLYKGNILLSVNSRTNRAKALAEHAGITIGGTAWMHASDIDAITKMLREARRVLRQHDIDVRKVAACDKCRQIFGGVCDRHRPLFAKYRKLRAATRKR